MAEENENANSLSLKSIATIQFISTDIITLMIMIGD